MKKMKKIILALVIVIGFSTASNAQTSSKMKMKDGVMMMDNKTMLCNHSKCTLLTKTYTCKDGCKVSLTGGYKAGWFYNETNERL